MPTRKYRFDYRISKPNRFAKRAARIVTVVSLDPDVAAVFPDSKRVNAALRAIIRAKHKSRSRKVHWATGVAASRVERCSRVLRPE
jgi:hypothetical protein